MGVSARGLGPHREQRRSDTGSRVRFIRSTHVSSLGGATETSETALTRFVNRIRRLLAKNVVSRPICEYFG